MKKLIKRNWPIVLSVLIVGLIIFLYRKGFRITYAPGLENDWEAISACAAWAGAIGTIAVLIYNHITIKLTQQSVQQAVDLQLYDKRQAVYDGIFKSKAFEGTPENIKILYSDEIYELHKEISRLCKERQQLVYGFVGFKIYDHWDIENLYNVCKETVNDIVAFLTPMIKAQELNVCFTEEQIKNKFDNIQEIQICTEKIEEKHQELQLKMEQFLKQSIGNE